MFFKIFGFFLKFYTDIFNCYCIFRPLISIFTYPEININYIISLFEFFENLKSSTFCFCSIILNVFSKYYCIYY